MSTVIGLCPRDGDIDLVLQGLEKAGFARERMRILNLENRILRLFGCRPNYVVAKYAGMGALMVGVIYGLAALIAGWCECNLFGFPMWVAHETLLAGLLGGAVIGGVMGIFAGIAEYEAETHLYTQGARMGGRAIVVQGDEGEVEKVEHVLQQGGSHSVRTLQASPSGR